MRLVGGVSKGAITSNNNRRTSRCRAHVPPPGVLIASEGGGRVRTRNVLRGTVPTCRNAASHHRSCGRASKSVRAPWSRHSPRALQSACASPRSFAPRPRVAARSPMSGASLRTTKAGECGREALIQSPRSAAPAVTRVRAAARRALPHPAAAPWRTYHRDAPASCSAFGGEGDDSSNGATL
jgi:hypothetical protein